MNIVFWGILILIAGLLLFSSLASFIEKEIRAGLILLITLLSFLAITIIPFILIQNNKLFEFAIILILSLILLLFFFPGKRRGLEKITTFGKRFHEADAVLSRRRLKPGTDKYKSYYATHPELKNIDDRARNNPGLLSEESKYFDPATFNAAKANFILTENLYALDDLPKASKQEKVDEKKLTSFIKKWMLETGAHSIGFTPLEDHHLYSHKGRGKRDGEMIINDLPHAIVLTVEMDYDLMKYAPAGPTVMESAEQYLQSGILATKLSLFIKELGYQAKVHIDGNYEVICPLVASDAGLGVIGRMGLLMTPRLGPRVRIAAVTTDLPLKYKTKINDSSVLRFCESCKKCAAVCPVKAIPTGPKENVEGNLRWKINSESCYNYWTLSGTDCGRCVISCPYSHPDTYFHRLIRWGIKNNLLFSRMAAKLDNVFYGRRPSVRRLPEQFTFRK